MKIGTIKEIKDNEYRVGLTPQCTSKLIENGHSVIIQSGAGEGAGFEDSEYLKAGAIIVKSPEEVVKDIDILVKVKEILREEYHLLPLLENKFLYSFLHLAGADKNLTLELLKNKVISVAYETIEDSNKKLVCLTPMSKVAGILAVQYASQFLQKKYNGRGITMGHIKGSEVAKVVIIGGGVVGKKAAIMAAGMGSEVKVFEINKERASYVKDECGKILSGRFFSNLEVLVLDGTRLAESVKEADVLIGSVLIKGGKAPKVVTKEMIDSMKKGTVIIDVAIDQGGCIWGSKPTSHTKPTFEYEGKIYCCIPNMPGQASLQATKALTNATFPYLLKLANKGLGAFREDSGFALGVNTYNGNICYEAVAHGLDLIDHYRKFE